MVSSDIGSWFNDPTYSDLTIKLSNGKDIYVHKLVVCNSNEYFRKLCGADSQFAESEQRTIELKGDNPAALEEVSWFEMMRFGKQDTLGFAVGAHVEKMMRGDTNPPGQHSRERWAVRHLYKLPISEAPNDKAPWRHWLSLQVTADKYLEPLLSVLASRRFRDIAVSSRDIDTIFDIITAIDDEMSYDTELVELAAALRQRHISGLLKNDRYRARLEEGDTKALWEQLDALSFAIELEEKSYTLCSTHQQMIFAAPVKDEKIRRGCSCCVRRDYTCEARAAWISKK